MGENTPTFDVDDLGSIRLLDNPAVLVLRKFELGDANAIAHALRQAAKLGADRARSDMRRSLGIFS